MNTYKIGNKIKCIIRACTPGIIGDTEILYENQPYTILKDVEAAISYSNRERDARVNTSDRVLAFTQDFVNEVTLSNITITDKILKLIYSKNEDKLVNTSENCMSDEENKIYLNTSAEEIYQVFIYDNTGKLENAYGTLDITSGIAVQNADDAYMVCYSYLGSTSVDLNRNQNIYLKLDLEVIGNTDETTTPMFIHIDKCAIAADKRLNFNRDANAIDITFKVINDRNTKHYISFK